MRVKLHPHARAELRAARDWYYERSPLSAIAFAQTVTEDWHIQSDVHSREAFPTAKEAALKSLENLPAIISLMSLR